ncbi:MAG: PhaM family polyhydroxyalkanoate granule multifunctional regulatory protein [Pseudomonadota bacterium]
MSDADNASNAFAGFGKLVPGFDFLKNLSQQAAGSASSAIPQMPKLNSWIAPTLSVEEIDKRIDELKTVQFWLDQNATALKATIQALEVQKMTLATLKGMNFNLAELASAFQMKMPEPGAPSAASEPTPASANGASEKPNHFPGLEVPETSYQKRPRTAKAKTAPEPVRAEAPQAPEAPEAPQAPKSATATPATVADPMQWWNALTSQFQNIAATAMKEASQKSMPDLAGGAATKATQDAMKAATGAARDFAESAGRTVASSASGATKAMSSALRSAQPWPQPAAAKTRTATAAKKPAGRASGKTTPAAKKPARKKAPASR